MQLDKIVTFHKALADPTRIRLLILLKNGPLHGQALAGKLGVKPPTITHHIAKLRDAGLIYQQRDKNTIYFYLDEKKLDQSATAILTIGEDNESTSNEETKEKYAVIGNFITAEGKLKAMPAQRKKKRIVLEYMLRGLQFGKKYPEKEINEYIQTYHEDFATIRREWIMNHFMYRENNVYELNPKEMWKTE